MARPFFDRSPSAILLIDTRDGTILEANPAAGRLLASPPETFAGRKLTAIFDPFEPGTTVVPFGAASETDPTRRYHRRLLAADGRVVWGILSATPLDDGETGAGIAAIQIEDITDLQQTAQVLAERKTLFRSVFNDAAAGMAISGPDAAVIEANPALAAMTGYSVLELRGQTYRELFAPESLRAMAESVARLVAGMEDHCRIEAECLRKDGSRFLGLVLLVAVRDGAGRLLRMIGQIEDITALRAAERTLADSQMLVRSAFHDAAIGMAVNGPDGAIIETNPAFSAMLGYSRDEMQGMTYRETTVPAFVPLNAREFARIVAGEIDRFTLEKQYLRKDGSHFWGRLTVSAVRDDAGELVRTVSQIEDISALKQAEQALASSEARLRSIFEDAPVGIAMVGPDGRFQDVNAAACALLGYRKDELAGQKFLDLTHPGDRPASEALFQRLADGDLDRASIEKRYLHKDGSAVWTHTNISCARGETLRYIAQCEDVSDLRAAREALARSEALLRSSFEDAAIGMALGDPGGLCVDANPAFCAMLGYRHDELVGMTITELTYPDDRAISAEHQRRVATGQIDHYSLEKRYLHKDGHPVWVRINVSAVRGQDGELVRLLSQAEDISDIHASQEALAASEAQLRSTFEDAAIGMSVSGPDDRFMDANPALCAMLGYERDELLGMGVLDVTHPDDRAETLALRAEMTAGRSQGYRVEKRYLRKDGSTVWGRVVVRMVRDADGRRVRSIAQIEDISEVRAAQDALAASEARYRSVVRNSLDAIAILDERMIVTWISPSIEILTGFDESHWIGLNPLEFIHPDDVAAMVERYGPMDAQSLARQQAMIEGRVRDSNGDWRWFEVTVDPPSNADVVGGYVFHLRDITASREAAQSLKEALALQQAVTTRQQDLMRERSEFLAMVAHDFRTPLTAIQGYADLLTYAASSEEDRREYAETIADSARRLNRMVESLMHLDRLEGDLPPLQPEAAEPAAIIESAVALARSAWPGREVELELAPGLPTLEVDTDLVGRAIGNLIDNAIKYSPAGGPVEVVAEPQVDRVRVMVRDHGIGIPARELPRIFEKFARVSDPAAGGVEGSGLGLPIVRAIARAHSGDAWAESEPGAGTTMHLVIGNAAPSTPTG